MVLGPELHPLALDLLTEAAVVGTLTASSALLLAREHLTADQKPKEEVREILGILEHDGYLRRSDADSYVFLSHLLRDWWRTHFGFGYVPAGDRKR